MIDRQISQMIRTTRGAPLTILFALFAADAPVSIIELAQATGYHRDTTADHLRRLAADGYASDIGGRWLATDKARQLPLPGLLIDGIAPTVRTARFGTPCGLYRTGTAPEAHTTSMVEAVSLNHHAAPRKNSAPGSSSSLVVIEDLASPEQLPPPAPRKNSAPAPQPDRRRLVDFLTDTCGCESRKIAQEAIDAALDDGDSPLDIEYAALWWLAYVRVKKPRVDCPGIFIARKVQHNEQVPNTFEIWPHDAPTVWPLIENVRRRIADAERHFLANNPPLTPENPT